LFPFLSETPQKAECSAGFNKLGRHHTLLFANFVPKRCRYLLRQRFDIAIR